MSTSSTTVSYDTAGKPIECKAMVARAAKQPLIVETITVDPPKAGEVRVKVIANALCHTDVYTCKKESKQMMFNDVEMYVYIYMYNLYKYIYVYKLYMN